MAACPGATVAVDEEDGATEKSCPVPLSDTIWGLPAALSVIVSVPLLLPLTVGSKETLIVQLEPAASELPQMLLVPKSAALVVTLAIVRAAFPVLVSIMLWDAPEVPTYWLGKEILDGVRDASGAVSSYNSAVARTTVLLLLTSAPPATSTVPLFSDVAESLKRTVLMLPVAVNAPVAGSYNSAVVRLLKISTVVPPAPPAIRTIPLLSNAAV